MSDKHSSANGSKKRTLSLSLSKKKQSSQLRLESTQGSLKQTQIHLRPPANGNTNEPCRSPQTITVSSPPPSSCLSLEQQQEQQQESITPSIGDYVCPICQADLGTVKSSFLRQRHVEACLEGTAQDSKAAEEVGEFEYCLFCGKNVAHLEGWRKDGHFGRCLDAYVEDEASSMSFVGQLEICPCCHEFGPFGRQRTVRKKIQHLKQCAKARQMSMQQLLQKLKWIGWGHVPVERQNTAAVSIPQEPSPPPPPPTTTTIRATALAEDDDDFSSVVLLHLDRRPQKKPKKDPGVDDDGLALALALSLSENQPGRSTKRSGATDTASVLSVQESKQVVQRELAALLYADEQSQDHSGYCVAPLPPSRLLSQARTGPSLWQLAAMENNVDNSSHMHRSKFLCGDGS